MSSAESARRTRAGRPGRAALLLLLCPLASCSSETSTGSSSSTDPNVLPVSVSGPLCSAGAYLNEPCVSVTVCTPGTRTCQNIGGILLDTGSTGLRLFRSVLSGVSPSTIAIGSATLAECVTFLDGSSDWGPVEVADVVLGGEPAVQVPIHVLDANFGPPPTACPSPDTGPADAGFNGILGVGVFAQDCESPCSGGSGPYFTCQGGSCTPYPESLAESVPLSDQVTNPVAVLPLDNNGVVVELPAVAASGVVSTTGSLTLGIGTRPNNTPANPTTFPLDENGEFSTGGAGIPLEKAFVDTGSNGLFFPAPAGSGLVDCGGSDEGWYCPPSLVTLSPTMIGKSGAPDLSVAFQIGDFATLTAGSASVFPDIGGGETATQGFDWGLPFFLGRTVYLGIEGASSSLGTGPYFAF